MSENKILIINSGFSRDLLKEYLIYYKERNNQTETKIISFQLSNFEDTCDLQCCFLKSFFNSYFLSSSL